MALTKQQLLIPRVLCIGGKEGEPNYPFSIFKTGSILILHHFVYYHYYGKEGKLIPGVNMAKETIEKFPHLFKPLPWWYGRRVEEMPEYVKLGSCIYKIVSWVKSSVRQYGDFTGTAKDYSPPIQCVYTTPADESDYKEYQKQKEA